MKIQHQQIIQEARNRGFEVKDVSDTLDTLAVIIEGNGLSELFIKGTPLSLINLRSLNYFDNKQLTKEALNRLNIPCPKSILIKSPSDKAISTFLENGKKYVCKPPNLAEGIGVEMHLENLDDIQDYWNRNQQLGDTFIFEEQIEGKDLRVQVLGGKIIAACTREPAFVTGDGTKAVSNLIEERRVIIQRQNPMNDLTVDKATLELLAQQNLNLDSIPKVGQKVQLKELANMSQGAVAIDVTDQLHPVFQNWIGKIVNYLKVDYFAIDFIAPDFEGGNLEKAVVLEINAQPEWLHHTFSEGKQHNIAKMVIDEVFEK